MYLYVIEVGDNVKVGHTNKKWDEFCIHYKDVKKHIFIKTSRAENISKLTKKSFKKHGNYIDANLDDVINMVKKYKSISKLTKTELINICNLVKIKNIQDMNKEDILKIVKNIE